MSTDKGSLIYVDDEASFLELYKDFLADDGFDVRTFSDHEEAMTEVRRTDTEPPRVIIADLMMPPLGAYDEAETRGGLMTGYSFYKGVQQLARLRKVPFIMLTNNVNA